MKLETSVEKVEDLSDNIFRKCRRHIAPIGRILLLLTFLEDAVRLVSHFGHSTTTSFEYSLIYGIVFLVARIYCIITQVSAPFLIARRKHVFWACAALASVLVLRTLRWDSLQNHRIITRSLGMIGGLVYLLAEYYAEKERKVHVLSDTLFNQHHIPDSSLCIFLGRIYCLWLTATIMHFKLENKILFQFIPCAVLMFPLLLGYKTKIAAVLMIIWSISVYYVNNFVDYMPDYTGDDHRKYDFFQTLSMIGSLLLLINYGPGEMSLDEYKKRI